MSTGFMMIIFGELALFFFIIWGYMHEDKFVEAEDRIIAKLKASIRKVLTKHTKRV